MQGFVKSLLDVADNLHRAIDVVPKDAVEGEAEGVDREKALQLLRGLHGGVSMTERLLNTTFKSQVRIREQQEQQFAVRAACIFNWVANQLIYIVLLKVLGFMAGSLEVLHTY